MGVVAVVSVATALAFTPPASLAQQGVIAQTRTPIPSVYMGPSSMNTRDTGPKKKKPTGTLMGYKVGNRAPEGSRASGSTKKEADAMT